MELKSEVKEFLYKNGDKKYLDFSDSLDKYKNYKKVGVRIPLLREYASALSKNYNLNYLYNNIDDEYYEEILLKGFIIGKYKKLSYEELKEYIIDFVPKIKDWSVCDTFCCSLKITKKYLDEVYKLINKYLKSKIEFEVRYALVMLLNYYINDEYIDKLFEIINEVKLDKYYVKMANAWLISFCMIKYFDKTYLFMKDNKSLDKWTYNKAIDKSIESFRLDDKQKSKLKKLKM